MAILTARYTFNQKDDEGLNTTPPIFNNAMGIVGSEVSTRTQQITNFIATNFPSSTFSSSPNQLVTNLSPNGVRDIYSGSFLSSFNTTSTVDFIERVSGTITGWSAGVYGANNNRYTVTGINVDAQQYFSTITWADILNGGDTLIGGPGSDTLQSYGVNNTFQGLGGNDIFIAADGGVSLAIFRGLYSDYSINPSDQIAYGPLVGLSGYTVNDLVNDRDGDTDLINVERLQFADTMLALDIAPNQTAGKVYMLYQATFNRTPDAEGLGYWIKQVDNGANITTDVAAFFVTSPEFVTKYGANPSVASYVDNLYLNVLGRPGEAGGVAYWNKELNAGRITRAAVLEAFATLPEGAALVADAIANGIQYQEWLG